MEGLQDKLSAQEELKKKIIKPEQMIPVTKPFIPPLSQYHSYLEGVWERNWLTNKRTFGLKS